MRRGVVRSRLVQMKVIPNDPGQLKALEEARLEIVERISIVVPASVFAAKYLRAKKEKLGHLLTVAQ